MNLKLILRIVAMCVLIAAAFMIPPLIICLLDGEVDVALSFLYTILLSCAFAGASLLLTKKRSKQFRAREGLAATGLAWIVLSLFGCLPFVISGQIPNFFDAYFEIVSGFTTTGASIVPNVEVLSRGILFWRSFSHWLGGMGVLVFLMAVVPRITKNSGNELHILRAESPGPSVSKLTPQMRSTAMVLYSIYVGLTVLNVIFLLAGGMSVFESLCTAFGTAGTGGFGVKADSLAGYSPYIQWVNTIFMALFGLNFNVYFLILMKKFKKAFFDEEVRAYFFILISAALVIFINILSLFDNPADSLRHAFFQVSSIMTTTGFSTVDFDLWPVLSKSILLVLMIIGACAGSTGGGIKVSRFLIVTKTARRSAHNMMQPNRIEVLKLNKQPLSEGLVRNVSAYLAVYCGIMLMSTLLISIDGMSIETNLSAVCACFNNIGPGMALVGPVCNYSQYSVLSKIVLTLNMLLGRLELYPILILFSRSAWRRGG